MNICTLGQSGLPYFKPVLALSKSCIYSCDNVRLNVDFSDCVKFFVYYLEEISAKDLRFEVKHYDSFKPFSYRHLWTFKDTLTECSWTIGLQLSEKAEDRTKGFIDFNPNKCMSSDLFSEFWAKFDVWTKYRELVRWDFAIDFHEDRSCFRLVRDSKKTYELIQSDDGTTEYLGLRNHSGRIKLYDKTKESHLNGEWTRLELTLDSKTSALSIFPTVYYTNSQQSILDMSELSSTQRVLVQALRESDSFSVYFQQLDRHTRKKIEPYLADTTLSLDQYAYSEVHSVALSFEKHIQHNNTHSQSVKQVDPKKHDMGAYTKSELKEIAKTQAIKADIAEKMEEIFG